MVGSNVGYYDVMIIIFEELATLTIGSLLVSVKKFAIILKSGLVCGTKLVLVVNGRDCSSHLQME